MLGGREECLQPLPLLVGEQVRPGVQGPPGPVERASGSAAMAVELLLDPAAAPAQRVAGEPDHVDARSGSSRCPSVPVRARRAGKGG